MAECEAKFGDTSGKMEVEGNMINFEHCVANLKLWYINGISDGNSKV